MDAELQKRLSRLQRGELSAGDVSRIFLGLREYSFGRKVFKEVADFIAHPQEKDQGPAYEVVRDLVANFRYKIKTLKKDVPYDIPREEFAEAMNATFRLGAREIAARKMGIRVEKADSIWGRVRRNMGEVRKGQLQWLRKPARQDAAFLHEVASLLLPKAAFTDKDLFVQFCEVIERNKLAEPDTAMAAFAGCADFIALFAIAHMQATRIRLANGEYIQLTLIPGDQLNVWARIPVTHNEKTLFAMASVFSTSLTQADHAEAGTFEGWDQDKPPPVEIGPNGKLRLIQ